MYVCMMYIMIIPVKNTLTFGVLILLSISNTDKLHSTLKYHTYVYITSHTQQRVNKANSDLLLLHCAIEMTKTVREAKVVDIEKRRYPSKHYVSVIVLVL